MACCWPFERGIQLACVALQCKDVTIILQIFYAFLSLDAPAEFPINPIHFLNKYCFFVCCIGCKYFIRNRQRFQFDKQKAKQTKTTFYAVAVVVVAVGTQDFEYTSTASTLSFRLFGYSLDFHLSYTRSDAPTTVQWNNSISFCARMWKQLWNSANGEERNVDCSLLFAYTIFATRPTMATNLRCFSTNQQIVSLLNGIFRERRERWM